jgi:hypothetical protein
MLQMYIAVINEVREIVAFIDFSLNPFFSWPELRGCGGAQTKQADSSLCRTDRSQVLGRWLD